MNLRALRSLGAAAAIAWGLAGTATASPVNIDTFDLGSAQGVVFDNNTFSNSEVIADTTQTIGGVRQYSVSGQTSNAGIATLKVGSGRLGMGTMTILPPYQGTWAVSYGSPASPLNADLVNDDGSPNSGVVIDMAFAEYDYDLELWLSPAGPTPYVTVNQPANMNPHSIYIPFSAFSGIDPANIDQIQVYLHGRNNGDYAMDRIYASVPEPITVALLAAGSLLVLHNRRRTELSSR